MMKKILLSVILFFGIFSFASANELIGTIDPQNQGFSKAYLMNTGGLNNISREINVGKFTTQTSQNIIITDHEISGWMWGAATGWISFSCINTNSCESSNYKVSIDNEGYLSGYAWGPQAGWINFAPSGANTQTVRIMPNGDFVGYAWSQVFGYISFNCSNDNSCSTTSFKTVTDFRPINYRSHPSGGSKKVEDEKIVVVNPVLPIKQDDKKIVDNKPIKSTNNTKNTTTNSVSGSKNSEGPSGTPNIVKFVPTTQPPEITQPKGSPEVNKATEDQKTSADTTKNNLKKKAGLGILGALLLIFLMTRI